MRTTIRVGVSTCGLAAGAEAVCAAIDAYLHRRQLPAPCSGPAAWVPATVSRSWRCWSMAPLLSTDR